MNFIPATAEDGTLHTPLGDIPLTSRLRQALERARAPRELIVGLRPEDFEDASLVAVDARPQGITLRAEIDVLESMGSDVFVYFTRELEQGVDATELQELARDSGRADTGASGDTVVARIDAATRLREGEDAELWVDVRKIHVFDPSTGKNLALEDGRDTTAPAAAPSSVEDSPEAMPAPGEVSPAASPADSPDRPVQ
jgi:multiple sugar transport system ATP-binding protein